MKTIASLTGPDFLRACNRTRHAVYDLLDETGVMELRKILPEIPEKATAAEKERLFEAQGKKNLDAILDRLLDEYPESTYKLICTMAIPEKKTKEEITVDEETGEEKSTIIVLDEYEELDGIDIIGAALDLIGSEKVMDFFARLWKSVLSIMDD